MLVHPALAALRSDDAPQRQAQTALFASVAAWREGIAAVLAELDRYAAGAEIADCQVLARIVSDPVAAGAFTRGFVATTAKALAGAPLGHVPLRHFTDGTISTLLLARSGRASLLLVAIDGAALAGQPSPRAVSFASSESREMILAGTARAELVSDTRSFLDLRPGSAIIRDCSRQALVLREMHGTLVSLRLQRRKEPAEPTREIDLATGTLIHQAASTSAESRGELMIALLARMGRQDAAPVLAEIAREAGPDGPRWQALRECLGLDTLIGFRALTDLALAEGDPLAVPAGALRAQLIEAHPELSLCLA